MRLRATVANTMKILLLNDKIPPEGQGGAEQAVWRLAQGLAAAGHDTHIATTTAGPAHSDIRAGVACHYIKAGYPERFRAWLSLWNPQTARAFRRLLKRIQPDVVNAHNVHFTLSWHTLKQANEAGCPVVYSAHDALALVYGKLPYTFGASQPGQAPAYQLPRGYNLRQNRLRYNPFRNAIIKRGLERYAVIRTAPSQALADAFADNGMPPVEVAHNGLDLDAWKPVDARITRHLREKLGLQGKRVILVAGRLTQEKGLRQVLLALDHLREGRPDLRLLMLTNRDIERHIPARLRQLVRAAGWLCGDELRAAYQVADLVTVPSIYLDPFPTVNLEAMAMGKPVVASCFGGSKEAVLDGETGFIVNPLDTAAFSARLETLLADDNLRRTMGMRGRERIHSRFSLRRQVAQMCEIYERAITQRKAASP